MGSTKSHPALKVSLVAQVLIESAFIKHRSLQGHTFESLVDKLENACTSVRPVLRFPEWMLSLPFAPISSFRFCRSSERRSL